jgi:hypothetical protein
VSLDADAFKSDHLARLQGLPIFQPLSQFFRAPREIPPLITAEVLPLNHHKFGAILTTALGARIVVTLLMAISRLNNFRGLHRLFKPFIVANEDRG